MGADSGERLGGSFMPPARVAAHRLQHFTSGNELIDMNWAMQESLRREELSAGKGKDESDQILPLSAGVEVPDPQLQEAIEASLHDLGTSRTIAGIATAADSEDEELQLALA